MAGRALSIGILTSGGDCPGLNAAIRGVAKATLGMGEARIVGIADGYRGLIEGRARELGPRDLSGILTLGGTILGASREKPFGERGGDFKTDADEGMDKPELIKANYRKLGLDCLVVLGGNGTQTTAALLQAEGLEVIGLPKTIDNDLWGTDVSFGFHSAVGVATEAIDRLHSTASSHNRVMVIELMGHKAGWLALYAGIAGGGDVVLLPEIPYDPAAIAGHLRRRAAEGKSFSIVVVAEGALSLAESRLDKKERRRLRAASPFPSIGYRVAAEIEEATGAEARVTVLGYLQRGGVPAPYDRLLATSLGAAAADLIRRGDFGRMVALRGGTIGSVALAEVAGKTRKIPDGHELLVAARRVGTCLGDA
ncbi:MAG: 6-phosphofructokinase [Spirochaetaceae bacterium]|nr:6-phosphofructokinase [Spirochaetaceae bacterium]